MQFDVGSDCDSIPLRTVPGRRRCDLARGCGEFPEHRAAAGDSCSVFRLSTSEHSPDVIKCRAVGFLCLCIRLFQKLFDCGVSEASESFADDGQRQVLLLKAPYQLQSQQVPLLVGSLRPERRRRWKQALLDVVVDCPRCNVGQVAEFGELVSFLGEHADIMSSRRFTVNIRKGKSLHIAQKLLIHSKRKSGDRAKDLLYIHDTVQLFSPLLDDLRAMWQDSIAPHAGKKITAKVVQLSVTVFEKVTDTIREASRIPAGRQIRPETMRLVCETGLAQIFGENTSRT